MTSPGPSVGYWELEDIVAARGWLVDQGISSPDQIILSGWSYGGYLTLLALGKRPELWAGGIAGVAVADLAARYEETTEDSRTWLARGFGGTPAELAEVYAASSPITYAERVAAPVLVLQGRHDPHCPAGQMERYEARMRALRKDIEVHWLEEGHVGQRAEAEAAIRNQELMLRFAARVLAGSRLRSPR
jgi:dipeptidyl aminopeptidase/acylaminoacyl peptidase